MLFISPVLLLSLCGVSSSPKDLLQGQILFHSPLSQGNGRWGCRSMAQG